mgnify:CR=1 FL=1
MGKKKSGKKENRLVNINKKIFWVLLVIVLLLGITTTAKAKGWLIPGQPFFSTKGGVIVLDSLTLEQKIAQMVIVTGIRYNYYSWRSMQVGGIYLFALQTENVFNNTIVDFQYDMPIHFFVTTDLEGCVNPFANLKEFPAASEINTLGEAFEAGFREGEYLRKFGFNLNFAPVVDLQDSIWKCRAFPGDEKQIAELAQAYTLGLQNQGIIATAKHYPGKTLVVKDPHKYIVLADISKEDVYPYKYLIERGDVKAVMVSHLITSGTVDSEGVPAVVSKNVIDEIKQKYSGLVISDEIHMLGLQNFYSTLDEMYIAVFKAGNDIVLNFDTDPNEIYRMIKVVAEAVEMGEIDKEQIDNSVRKILEAKGFVVV